MSFFQRTTFLLLLTGLILSISFVLDLSCTYAEGMSNDQGFVFIKKGVASSGIAYFSGGVGLEEREAMEKIGRKYPLKLVFAIKGGIYLSVVKVRVYNEEGKMLFKTTSNGPWLYINLPDGFYNIKANNKRGAKEINEIKVSKGRQKIVVVSLP